ncbi:MAG TPA: BrnT family toxin [Rhodoblastus sp.]|nr:BrnT family toxin [Rhodoblastus sp.]
MIITWDEAKRLANLDKHGLDFSMLTLEFFERSLVIPARSSRFKAVGRLADQVLVVVFAPLGTEAIAVISMRAASRNERVLFDERQANR